MTVSQKENLNEEKKMVVSWIRNYQGFQAPSFVHTDRTIGHNGYQL